LAIEEPKYTVFLHDGDCEIRDYQAAVAAEVTVVGDQHAAARKDFACLPVTSSAATRGAKASP